MQVTYCTRQARMLLRGRNKGDGRDIVGLQRFARQAWLASRMSAGDDPFADYALMQVEAAHREVRQTFLDIKSGYLSKWHEHLPDIAGGLGANTQPRSMRMRFATNSYADMAMALILQMDNIVQMLEALHKIGILEKRDVCREANRIASGIRRMMSVLGTWTPTGCMRQDLAERNATAIASIEQLTKRRFINHAMFSTIGELCDFFAKYDYCPEFSLVVDAEMLLENSRRTKKPKAPSTGAIGR